MFFPLAAAAATSCCTCNMTETLIPVRQSSSKMAFDVRVHDRFEMLELAVLEEVDDMDLRIKESTF